MTNNNKVYILLFLCLTTWVSETQGVCISGWFGSNCQFQCHCYESTTCDSNGQCLDRCASGFFGSSCQYQDLGMIPGASLSLDPMQTPGWLQDGNSTSCTSASVLSSATFSWNVSYPFTWLRVEVKSSSERLNFNLSLRTNDSRVLNCTNLQISLVDDKTADYRCYLNEAIQQLTVTGTGLLNACSLYVSGGRNLALKQSADQSSTLWPYYQHYAQLAVDGNTMAVLSNNSCMHTGQGDAAPFWTLTMYYPIIANRFIIYNRECSPGLWGLECNQMCPKECSTSCHQDTGKCIPCLGYYETPECVTPCQFGTYGFKCQETCTKCHNTSCNNTNGDCLRGCLGYSNPPECSISCDFNKWGLNCGNSCGANCFNQSCDRITGVCNQGCNGYSDSPNCTIGNR